MCIHGLVAIHRRMPLCDLCALYQPDHDEWDVERGTRRRIDTEKEETHTYIHDTTYTRDMAHMYLSCDVITRYVMAYPGPLP